MLNPALPATLLMCAAFLSRHAPPQASGWKDSRLILGCGRTGINGDNIAYVLNLQEVTSSTEAYDHYVYFSDGSCTFFLFAVFLRVDGEWMILAINQFSSCQFRME